MKQTVTATIPDRLPYDQYTGMPHAKVIKPTLKQERMQSMIYKSIEANKPDLDRKLRSLLKENDMHTKIAKYKETVEVLKSEILKDLEITKAELMKSKEYTKRKEQYVELNKHTTVKTRDLYIINKFLSFSSDL